MYLSSSKFIILFYRWNILGINLNYWKEKWLKVILNFITIIVVNLLCPIHIFCVFSGTLSSCTHRLHTQTSTISYPRLSQLI